MTQIRQRLLAGEQPVALVKAGFPKSSVYHVAKQVGGVRLPVESGEVVELRERKQIVTLQKDIQDIEAEKEKLPERVKILEQEVVWLHEQIDILEQKQIWLHALVRSVGNSLVTLLVHFASPAGNEVALAEGKDVAKDWVQREIEPKLPEPRS